VVDARTVDEITETRADALGRDLTPDERAETIQRHVDQEIVLREAYRLGIHETDAMTRARLLRRMRAALSEGVPMPSRSQLLAYFNTNSATYQMPEAVTFAHVFYQAGSDRLPQELGAPLAALADGADFGTMGDRFWRGPVLAEIGQGQLAGALGPGFAAAVFALPAGEWRGPFESSRGTHYVAVVERMPPRIPPFEAVEARVAADWSFARVRDLQDRRLDRMRLRYDVEYDTEMDVIAGADSAAQVSGAGT
jgi:hypothetical protein